MMSFRALVRVLAVAGSVGLAGCGYNAIQTQDEAVDQALGQVKVQLQRRYDLIPNLVETVKGFAAHETEVFTAVADARSRLSGALQSADPDSLAAAERATAAPLARLLAIAEQYPDLKSNANFVALQDQLEGTENRISVARQDYNAAVGAYNTLIRKFPYNLTAKLFGQGAPRKYFDLAADSVATTPKVKF